MLLGLFLILTLTISNCLEIVGYSYHTEPDAITIFLRIYYVSLLMLFAFLVKLSILTVFDQPKHGIDVVNFGLAILLSLLILFTDITIAGAVSIGYTVTRIPGPAYWIFQIYAISTLLISLTILVIGYRSARSLFVRIQALYILVAVFLLALPIVGAIAAMALGFEVNAAFVLPIGITLFLCMLTYTIRNEKLFDIRTWWPFSTRYKLLKAIHAEFKISQGDAEISLRERQKNLEKIFLLKALLDYGGHLNQKEIAKKIGISESALSKKRREYQI